MFMTFNELEIEQKKNLDYKEATARDVVGEALSLCKHRPAVAFSGGKDSLVVWDLIRRYYPEWNDRLAIIFGNTGVEYPESLRFARKIGTEWGGKNFYEAKPLRTEEDCLKYPAQREVLDYLIQSGKIKDALKEDGKLKSTQIIETFCPPEMMERFRANKMIWKKGTPKSYMWCADQYGFPLLGKAFSKLGAHRINIDCFLKFSASQSKDPKLLAYYEILKQVKISQMCCHFLKKEPSEVKQAELGIDVIFKGLMAAESRSRQTNFTSRGYIFKSRRPHLDKDPFYHCNPISIWTDDDVWEYIHKYNLPYSPLYDMGWTDSKGVLHKIPRNGCIGCGTDLLYPNNHLATLRRTHPQAWRSFMKIGLAEEIKKLQQARRNGQMSILDLYDTDKLLEERPCAFDRIDKWILSEDLANDSMKDYDPEESEAPNEDDML